MFDIKNRIFLEDRMNRIHSEQASNTVFNPLYDIELDIRNLMKRCGSLENELKECNNKAKFDKKGMLLKFIAVADAIENIFRNSNLENESANQQSDNLIKNFQLVLKMCLRELNDFGVTPFKTVVGDKANPDFHNIIEIVKEPDKENDIIIDVFRKGYLWNGKVLREAEVKIVKNN